MSNSDTKFDNWTYVDCNDCQNYWNDTCDGVSKAKESTCTAFIATRRVDIPDQIKSLRSALKGLRTSVILLSIGLILHALGHLLTSIVGG